MNQKQFHERKTKELEEISICSMCIYTRDSIFRHSFHFLEGNIQYLLFTSKMEHCQIQCWCWLNNIHFWRNHTGTNLWFRPKKAHWETDSKGSSLIVVPVFQLHRNSLSALSVWSRDLWLIIAFPMSACLCFSNS